MKVCVFCVILLASCGSNLAWSRGDLEKYGPFQNALYSKYITCDHDKDPSLDVSLTNVYFYDFSRNEEPNVFSIYDAPDGILSLPKLEVMRRFTIFVPGFKSNINSNTVKRVRDAFRGFPNIYLIILDHSPYTNDKLGYLKSYERSVQYVSHVGKALGEMLALLRQGGISAQQIHCVGHSLGGQMIGYTGQHFLEITGTPLWRVTALDPAGPCFSNSFIEDQVRTGVAQYVEVYHCNAGTLGSSSILADIDFFLNKKGQIQPNCRAPIIPGIFDSSRAAKCSHNSCVQIWTASVKHPDWFLAWRCESYKEFLKGECSRDDVTLAGFWNPGNATGVYFFNTEGQDDIRLTLSTTTTSVTVAPITWSSEETVDCMTKDQIIWSQELVKRRLIQKYLQVNNKVAPTPK